MFTYTPTAGDVGEETETVEMEPLPDSVPVPEQVPEVTPAEPVPA